MKILLLLSFQFFILLNASAQTYSHALEDAEKRLSVIFGSLLESTNSETSLELNTKLQLELYKALMLDGSFDYPFENLSFLGKVCAQDQKIRIYSWNIAIDNISYYYGCIIQQKDRNIISILNIKDFAYKPSQQKVIDKDNWYGALYYNVIPIKKKKNVYYILFAWAGNDDLTNYKFIDVLSFDNKGNPILGKDVFKKRNRSFSRIVFEYGDPFQMAIEYDSRKKMIIFDHLSPSSEKFNTIFSDYGPDFSYDTYRLKKNKWIFKADVDARNKD